MEIIVTQVNKDRCKIQIIGQFWQREECALFRNSVHQCIDKGIIHIVVDLSRLSYTSSQGLGTLVTSFSEIEKVRGSFSLLQPRGIVKELIELSGFNTFMRVSDSEQELGLVEEKTDCAAQAHHNENKNS